jgi:methylenetetrahydrofolate dehydrogenase (NADP+)/methenyltetrahydrofolate cyclohydrolase
MTLELVRAPHEATTSDVTAAVAKDGADAVIVQLPLPDHIDTAMVLAAIPLEKDADVLSDSAYKKFEHNEPRVVVPPVAGAVKEILKRAGVEVQGKRAVVVGPSLRVS